MKFEERIQSKVSTKENSNLSCSNCTMVLVGFLRLSVYTGELGYDGLNGTRKFGPSYAKSVIYI